MPDRGAMEPGAVSDVAFTSSGTKLVMPDAAWLQVTFEVDREAALAHMPCEIGRPIPPYGRLLVATSSVGSLAILSVGGRYRMMPRNVVVQSVSQGFDRVAGAFGNGASVGTVALKRSGPEVSASVSADGEELAAVLLPDLYAIEPTMLRWDSFVAMARADGQAVIGEVTPEHEVAAAFLSKQATITPGAGLARQHPWYRLRSLVVISACYAEGTLVFEEPLIQQTWS